MTDQVDLSIRQFVGGWHLFCAPAPNRALDSADGLEYAFSGVPIAFMNAAVITKRGVSADALQAFGRDACQWAAPVGVPWALIVTRESLDRGVDVDAVLEPCGLAPLMTLTGMTTRDVTPAARVPEGLEVVTPTS